MTTPIDSTKLQLSTPEPLKVSANSPPQYQSRITHDGRRIKLKPLGFRSDGLRLYSRNDKLSAVLPVDDWLRSQLDKLEKFVVENVIIPSDVPKMEGGGGSEYKALFRGDPISINVSQWCKYRMIKTDGTIVDVPLKELNQPGMIEFVLDIPFVYMRHYKSGERYSLTIFVNELLITPTIPAQHSSVTQTE